MTQRLRDNYGRFAKNITTRVSKELEERAKVLDMNLKQDVADEMLRTLKHNVAATYSPRAGGFNAEQKLENKKSKNAEAQTSNEYAKKVQKATGKRQRMQSESYKHTGILLDSLYADIEGDKVSIKILDISYPANPVTGETRSAQEVYDFLRHGTNPPTNSSYPYKYKTVHQGKKTYKKPVFVHNNPTPKHPFVEDTQAHMNSYINDIKAQVKNKTYKNASGYSIKKGRR